MLTYHFNSLSIPVKPELITKIRYCCYLNKFYKQYLCISCKIHTVNIFNNINIINDNES